MNSSFFGGVALDEYKSLTAACEPLPIDPPAQVVLPMRQHIGAACTPTVKVGDRVNIGDVVGDGEGLCAPVHASVSGVVAAVESRPHPSGGAVVAVVLNNNKKNTRAVTDPHIVPLDPDSATPEQMIAAVRAAGIVGMGGAAFPTETKLRAALGRTDTLILNGCECEPYITSDDHLMRLCAKEIADGLLLVARLLGVSRVVVAAEDNKAGALAAMRVVLEGRAETLLLPTRYPQGAEKQLIYAVTGRRVPSGGLPADVGCVVFNAATVKAIYDALFLSRPLTERLVTVSGAGVTQPNCFFVPIGTPVRHVIDCAGSLTADADRVIVGGPMMGGAIEDLDLPILKASGSVLCLTAREPLPDQPVCIRCGRCAAVCPMRLMPLFLAAQAARDDLDLMRAYDLYDCIECGCCAYVCPGKLPLVDTFRAAKRAARAKEAAQ